MPRHTRAEDRDRARDAGRKRQQARSAVMRRRLAESRTPEAEMNMAFDWARSSIRHLDKSGVTRTGESRNRDGAVRIMRKVTAFLAQVGEDIDNGRDAA